MEGGDGSGGACACACACTLDALEAIPTSVSVLIVPKPHENTVAPPSLSGVAAAMAPVADVEERIHMLLVHGLCHLLNYDHETEDEFEDMVALEDELLATYRDWRQRRR